MPLRVHLTHPTITVLLLSSRRSQHTFNLVLTILTTILALLPKPTAQNITVVLTKLEQLFEAWKASFPRQRVEVLEETATAPTMPIVPAPPRTTTRLRPAWEERTRDRDRKRSASAAHPPKRRAGGNAAPVLAGVDSAAAAGAAAAGAAAAGADAVDMSAAAERRVDYTRSADNHGLAAADGSQQQLTSLTKEACCRFCGRGGHYARFETCAEMRAAGRVLQPAQLTQSSLEEILPRDNATEQNMYGSPLLEGQITRDVELVQLERMYVLSDRAADGPVRVLARVAQSCRTFVVNRQAVPLVACSLPAIIRWLSERGRKKKYLFAKV